MIGRPGATMAAMEPNKAPLSARVFAGLGGRKLAVAIVFALIVAINDLTGKHLDGDTIDKMATAFGAFLLAEGTRDIVATVRADPPAAVEPTDPVEPLPPAVVPVIKDEGEPDNVADDDGTMPAESFGPDDDDIDDEGIEGDA